MIVVSNTSPINNLASVNQLLDQLRISGFWMREQLYNQVSNLANE